MLQVDWIKLAGDIIDIYNDNTDMQYKFSGTHEVEYFINHGEDKISGLLCVYLKDMVETLLNEELRKICESCIRSDEQVEVRTPKRGHRPIEPKGH